MSNGIETWKVNAKILDGNKVKFQTSSFTQCVKVEEAIEVSANSNYPNRQDLKLILLCSRDYNIYYYFNVASSKYEPFIDIDMRDFCFFFWLCAHREGLNFVGFGKKPTEF